MRAFFRHLSEQPFIMATGIAALIHSTWSLATLFAGKEPPQMTVAWFAWIVPALLIAFALDVGQIVTSYEIRAGQRTRAKYATFVVFSVATYFLQWLHIIHHIPALDLSEGVRGEWHYLVNLIRDCAIWIIPALLPLSTLLYTFSSQFVDNEQMPPPPKIDASVHSDLPLLEADERHDTPLLEEQTHIEEHNYSPPESTVEDLLEAGLFPSSSKLEREITPDELLKLLPMPIVATCPKCGWTKSYADELSAKRGLAGHKCLAKSSHSNNGVAKRIGVE